jgi:hypothetical protein
MTNVSGLRDGARVFAITCALALASVPARAATIEVPAGGDLQAALNAAQPGDVVLLAAGAVFQGRFTLPVKNNPQQLFITIRSAADDRVLPPAGVRMTPGAAAQLPKLRSSDTLQALYVPPGASHWRVQLVEFQANVSGSGDIIRVGSHLETEPSRQPHHIVFERVYVHGDSVFGQKNGLAVHASHFELRDSYVSDIKQVGIETHAFVSYNGAGPYLLENNYLEASSINVLFGGADPVNASMVPSDITIRRNHVAKNLAWMSPRADGRYWNVKNLLELKSGRRVAIYGNLFEHNWTGAGDQPGYAVLLRTENTSGACAWCETSAVTFENNVVRHTPAGLSLIGLDYSAGSIDAVRMNAVTIRNNLFDDLDANRWYVGSTRPTGRFAIISGVDELTFDHNTIIGLAQTTLLYFMGGYDSQGFVYTNNMSEHELYGIKGDSTAIGTGTLTAYTASYLVTANIIAGGSASAYPAGNFFPSVSVWQSQLVDPASGDYRLVDSSPYRYAGTDGRALGADFDQLAEAMSAPGPPPGPSNRPPVAQSTSIQMLEDAAVTVTLLASDPDGDELTFGIGAAPSYGTLTGTAPTLTYTPRTDYNGTDGLSFTVADGQGGTATGTVAIAIAPVNDAPVARPVFVSTMQGTAMRFMVDASDVDGDVLTYSAPATTTSGTLSHVAGPTFEYTPNAGFQGSDGSEYTVRDSALAAATAPISFTVTATNTPPVASAQTVTTSVDTPVAIVLAGSDPEGDALVWSTTAPQHGTLSGTAPHLTYTPAAGFTGEDAFTYAVSDGQFSATATVTIDVSDAATLVAITTASLADARVGKNYVQMLQATGGTMPYRWSVVAGTLPAGLSINATNGRIYGFATAVGSYAFTVRVVDARGAAADRSLTIRVVSR